ncbi:MAG: NUDIX hydrolase [Desulfosarcina sp.]|jgi:8-oxo-dGTP pyrophosphatase MutT (NUDIX family)
MPSQPQQPARPSPSATLILARDHETDLQVYLLRRSFASAFMPGTYVFPGGNLETGDMDTAFWQKHVDLVEDQLAMVLGGEKDRMLPYAVAAIRETWEEAGLLLSVSGVTAPQLEPSSHDATDFNRWIAANDIRLSISELGRWHHWITPELMPRRFDTFFFTAPVGHAEKCRPDNREAVHGIWIHPRQALIENNNGSLPLSPPTLVTLHQMLPFASLDALVSESRRRGWPNPIMPRLWPLEDSALIIEPWDPDYARTHVQVDVEQLDKAILPVGAPFSRLWRNQGICRPVRHPEEKDSRP